MAIDITDSLTFTLTICRGIHYSNILINTEETRWYKFNEALSWFGWTPVGPPELSLSNGAFDIIDAPIGVFLITIVEYTTNGGANRQDRYHDGSYRELL